MKRMFTATHRKRAHGTLNSANSKYAAKLDKMKENGEILGYWVEALKLRVTGADGGNWYTPDFIVQSADGELQIHEVKGSEVMARVPASQIKTRVIADNYPFRLFIAIPNRVRDGGGWTVREIESPFNV